VALLLVIAFFQAGAMVLTLEQLDASAQSLSQNLMDLVAEGFSLLSNARNAGVVSAYKFSYNFSPPLFFF